MTDRRAALVYALLFYTAMLETAIAALIPTYVTKFGISKVEVGILLASTNVAVLVLSVPIGLLADRVGAGLLTFGAAALDAVAALGQGLAPTFPLLCASWALFGVGVAAVVTAGLGWLSQGDVAARRARLLSGSTTISGAGLIAGPLFGGFVVSRLGLGAPFVVAAISAAVLSVLLAVSLDGVQRGRDRQSLRDAYRVYRTDRKLLAGIALALLLAVSSSTINVLIPLRLHANGVSASAIGLLFSVAACLFVVVSGLVTRRGQQAARLGVAAAATLLIAGAFSIPIATLTTLGIIGFVILRAPLWAVASTITYPLSADGAHRVGLSHSANFGLINLAWGIPAVIVPPLAGVMAQTIGERWAYAAALAYTCLTGCWLYRAHRAESAAP